ncbi:ribosomal protein L1 [Rhizopogon vinicolor AM-OR11-026]|uniref:Ribosomal L1 domain-containing protein 1 n=1 Tax=Rhizopogon vinicolor AM-OR11-026 TaxID=1314800 RepID=A0A1B7N777_9AGAM|nr:ribosomal protein L1 [Rhizopogon vinicolor AM-OR11-026]
MPKTELIDSQVSVKQCTRAVHALHAYASKKQKDQEENELLTNEQYVWLQIAVKQMHPEKKIKPFRIPLKHALVDPRVSPVCLITKDPQREYKDLLESHKIKFISRVVGIEKLKGKFKSYEARRMLLKENGMFLADERVIPLLPGLLGKKWFDAKKQPIPVCMTRKDLKGELERAIESSYMHQNRGTCTSVKIGLLSHTPEKIIDNLKSSLPAIVKNIKDGWDNIQSLNIKTNSSVSLPIWTCELGVAKGGRWDGMVKSDDASIAGESEEGSDADEANMDSEEQVPAVLAGKGKGGKKPLNENVEKPVTTKDMKRKRSVEGGVKKKAKIVKDGLTKSAGASDGGSDSNEASMNLGEHVPAVAGKGKRPLNEDVQKPVTPKDVKQKRSAEGGAKKKAKIVNGGLTKSAKGELIGKKPGRP